MVFPRKFKLLLLFLISLIFPISINAQIIFRELPGYKINLSDSAFFETNQFRNIIPLNGGWQVYTAKDAGDSEKQKVSVSIPSVFEGNGDLIFEKNFSLSEFEIKNHQMRLVFGGVNYSAEISVNGKIIYTHTGGEFPFWFELPRDILHSDRDNILSVKVHYRLDSENTIPLKQRFLFPKNFGGIFRDVYIELRPNISFTDFSVASVIDNKTGKAKITIQSRVSNQEFNSINDTLTTTNNLLVKTKIISPDGLSYQSPADVPFELKRNKEMNVEQYAELNSPVLWTPDAPKLYTLRIELWKNKNLIDAAQRQFAVYSLSAGEKSLRLNNEPFALNGVTYIPSNEGHGDLFSYSDMEKDIRMIKDLGFNAVRFAKAVPHPYYLYLCERYGLLAFIEIPLNSVPEKLAQSPNFIIRSQNYFTNFIKAYKNYSIAAIGLGGSYLTNSDDQTAFLKNMSSFVKRKTSALIYASFTGFNIPPINDIDFYGVELLNSSIKNVSDKLEALQDRLGAGKIFISEATYLVNKGSSDGFVNAGSYEAQAKYFDDLLDYAGKNNLAGYFINSMFDYRGEFASVIAGYNENNIYRTGICGEDRGTNRLGYKVLFSRLHNNEKVTIPIGSTKDTAPMSFILFGLFLAVVMGVLVNSGKKFREDASRALLRPYNFFADVRDQRIMSGYQTAILVVVISAVGALIAANLLSYLKNELIMDKILLAFGSHSLIRRISYLAWHPVTSLLWLTIMYLLIIILLSIIIKAASFFVKNRVYFSGVFYTVVWSFLPLVLLIPVGIILYRILNAKIANDAVYWGMLVFKLWIFYRLMKGIYVIFDVNAGSVYFYSILLLLLIFGGFLLYYQVNNSVVNYLLLTFKQFKIGI